MINLLMDEPSRGFGGDGFSSGDVATRGSRIWVFDSPGSSPIEMGVQEFSYEECHSFSSCQRARGCGAA